ncbi:hypothetical protein CBR_g38622 [Chara braunii]|uniref:Uncharacterized protein n=1 Tax=Chara braunii TaxID=69332 RepID=A0A388K0L0_CHABU|nr:hypothetical protein CBR_g38622 [Chara braunii]|eukprot:GBG63555.1 hypothetical protein CBR_g38622 [Chara braunii]
MFVRLGVWRVRLAEFWLNDWLMGVSFEVVGVTVGLFRLIQSLGNFGLVWLVQAMVISFGYGLFALLSLDMAG